jgi:hypothetical protein
MHAPRSARPAPTPGRRWRAWTWPLSSKTPPAGRWCWWTSWAGPPPLRTAQVHVALRPRPCWLLSVLGPSAAAGPAQVCCSLACPGCSLLRNLPFALPPSPLGIAWAICEHFLARGCYTLFATHFKRLEELASLYPNCKLWHMQVRAWECGRQVVPGAPPCHPASGFLSTPLLCRNGVVFVLVSICPRVHMSACPRWWCTRGCDEATDSEHHLLF